MIINESIVKSGISRMLKDKFPECEVYKEKIPEEFKKGSFTIQRILSTRSNGIQSDTKFYNQRYDYVISYFTPDNTNGELLEELDEVLDKLYILFNYIDVKDKEGNKGKIKVNEKSGEVIDEILRFNITVTCRIVTKEESEKLKRMQIIERIKE